MLLNLPWTDPCFILNIIAEILSGRSVFISQRMFYDERSCAFDRTGTAVAIEICCGITRVNHISLEWKLSQFISQGNGIGIQC